jgi:formate transporter
LPRKRIGSFRRAARGTDVTIVLSDAAATAIAAPRARTSARRECKGERVSLDLRVKKAQADAITLLPTAEDDLEQPRAQYIDTQRVLVTMGRAGARRIKHLSPVQVFVLAMMGGFLIGMGALVSILLASGIGTPGTTRLLEGFGFSAGFFFVILSEAVLFSEANVMMPAALLENRGRLLLLTLRFWLLAFGGNLAGAYVFGVAVHFAQVYGPSESHLLQEVIDMKLQFRATGGAEGWFKAVVSGVFANWLVGLAAFFATMGRSLIGKYIPVLLAVIAFDAANFQHAPANMAFFGLINATGHGPGWGTALAWSVAPAAVGNLIGGFVLVVLPFWLALRPHERAAAARECSLELHQEDPAADSSSGRTT